MVVLERAITSNQGLDLAQAILNKVRDKHYALHSELPEDASEEEIIEFIEGLGGEPVDIDWGEGSASKFQYSSMLPANEENLGKVIQYTGITKALSEVVDPDTGIITLINGGFYECVKNDLTSSYYWKPVDTARLASAYMAHQYLVQANDSEMSVIANTDVAFAIGAIVQYIGQSNENYINGHFYKRVSDGDGGYMWEEVSVGGGAGKDLSNKDVFDPESPYGDTVHCAEGAEIFNDYTGNIAIGEYSHAEGSLTRTNGAWSHAEGRNTNAEGSCSHAEGQQTKTYGSCAHAEGNETYAEGDYSHTEGYATKATSYYAHAEGYHTIASNDASHACGYYNKYMDYGEPSEQEGDAFVIGNGDYWGNRSNAFRVTFAGETYGLSAFNASGADYAEYFEWLDGNPSNEDRVGYFVTLKGRKIVKAKDGDYILGIVSGNPCMIGNSDEDWLGRWEHDEFDRFIREEVKKPVYNSAGNPTGEYKTGWALKANPNYDSEREYTERKDRPEWDAIGMVGVLSVWDDGTCAVDGYAKVSNGGKATRAEQYIAGQTYRVVERVTNNIVRVVLK